MKDALTSALAAAYFAPNNPEHSLPDWCLVCGTERSSECRCGFEFRSRSNSQFANARYILAAVYAKQGDIQKSLEQIKAISAMSSDNASAVASQLIALESGKNPFPANLLSTPPASVNQ